MIRRILIGLSIAIVVLLVLLGVVAGILWSRYGAYVRLLRETLPVEETTYLVFFQNALELRPTGGYLGNFIEVTIQDRQLKGYRMVNTNEFDAASPGLGVPMPDGFRDLLPFIQLQQLRDSNWDPDFPTSAAHMMMLYELQGGDKDVSGVLAVDSHILPMLLDELGSVYVETIGGDPITSDDVLWRVQYDTNQGFLQRGAQDSDRKEGLVDLVEVIESRIWTLGWRGRLSLLNRFIDYADRKHILAYFENEKAQQIVSDFGWDGGINQDSEYFFQLIDANLGGLKTDFFMERDVTLDLNDCDEGLCVEARIVYRNTAEQESILNETYKTYSRVYLPEEAFITEISGIERNGLVDYSVEHNRKVGGFRLLVPVNQNREVVVKYHQPRGEDSINFLIAKQPGILNKNVTIRYNGVERTRVMDRDIRLKL